jgi:hypothetical protein
MLENRPLNRTFGSKKDEHRGGWRKLTIEELPNLDYLLFNLNNGSFKV